MADNIAPEPSTPSTDQPDQTLEKGEDYFVVQKTDEGRHVWTLWASNGRALAQSAVGYSRLNDATRALRRMIAGIPSAEIMILDED